MHLQVESDIRQGLVIMKYVIGHGNCFTNPTAAYMIGFMQLMGGIFAEIACVLFLSSLDDVIEIIIRFIALGSIAQVDDFYAASIP